MKKRFFIIILCLLLLIFSCACNSNSPEGETEQEAETDATPEPDTFESETGAFNPAKHKIGFLVESDSELNTYLETYGFLRTAEKLGYAAELYCYQSGNQVTTVKQAIVGGCEGFVCYDPNGNAEPALKTAKEQGAYIVSSYGINADADASVAANQTEYLEEIARSIAERMKERGLKTGKILLYGYPGSNMTEAASEFERIINELSLGYTVVPYERSSQAENRQAQIDSLADYIYFNRDVKGLFCLDEDGSAIAVSAREKAQKMFKGSLATPSPTPSPTSDPTGATPVPVNENLLKEILISVFGTGVTEENIKLMNSSDIYGMVCEPHYESASQAVMLLDKLLRGQTVSEENEINMPIVRKDALSKYRTLIEQVEEWFELSGED